MADELATKEDVVAALGRDLTTSEAKQVIPHLTKVSELFRLEARQQFTPGRSTNRLRVTAGGLTLPQRPVRAVLTVDGQPGDRFTLLGQRLEVPAQTGTFVVVDYEHGYDAIPGLVVTTVAGIVAQLFEADPRARAGVSQRGETRGPFSVQETYAAWAQGAAPRLAPDDVKVAQSYRVKSYGLIVQGY
ncbi:hypothetical protein DEJ30_11945 [Curtobacterium sp. MCPF17_003]|uniref:hypothetical protein n=1 Tax=Curtobacterium sp. MCPF17_003 TaxID=2175637 RepID=UPI000D8571C1|nr:hypothetical protein [Curtobacterium sp. MCPF17_003]PYY63618.1 hypothetical protein DEJ30_11945 [Curtobacterium sp. MCPF17_003]